MFQVKSGYVMQYCPNHPRAGAHGSVLVHILVAEQHAKVSIPFPGVVHHKNGIRHDNRPGNLVICQDAQYHATLHQRMRALKECGNPNWRRCYYCKEWDADVHIPRRGSPYHRKCASVALKAFKAKKPKTGTVSNAMKTHCKHGHEYTPENTYHMNKGGRDCRQCIKTRNSSRSRKERAA